MGRREEQRHDVIDDRRSMDRLLDAVERDDDAEVERFRSELAAEDEPALLKLEDVAERAARARGTTERVIDRVRNMFQAIVLLRFLRARRP